MIKSLSGLSKRFFKANKCITVSCIIAISLSTMLIICLMNFSVNSKEKLRRETLDKFGDFDILCGYDDSDQKMNDTLLNAISSLEEVEGSSPAIVNYTKANNIDVYTVGVENDHLSKSRYKYNEDIQEDAAVINEQLADTLDLKIGDNILINNKPKKIIEIFKDETYSSNSLNMAIIKRSELKELLGYNDEADFVMIKAKNQEDIPNAVFNLNKLDNNLRIDEFQEDESLKSNVNSMMYFIGFLGILVFIMCGLFITSNLQGYMYKYTKDFAIIKAIGGSTKQVFITVLIQTLMINVIGIFSGLSASFLIYKVFLKSFEYYMAESLKIALCGFVLIQIILLIPSFKTAKILPIKAMEKNNNTEFKHRKLMKNIMICIFVIGTIIILHSIVLDQIDSFRDGVSGFLCIYFSTFLFVLLYVNKILKSIARVLKVIIDEVGNLAMKMLKYQVKKNSILIFSVTTMITITVIGGSFVRLIETNNENYYKNEYLTNIVLTSDKDFTFEDMLQISNDMNDIDNTNASFITSEEWTEVRMESGRNNGIFILSNLDKLMEQGLIKSFDNPEKKVLVSADYANKNNIAIGDKIKLISIEHEKQSGVSYENKDSKEYEYDLEVGSIENSKIMDNIDLLIDISNSKMVYMDVVGFQKMYISTQNKNIDTFLKNEKLKYENIKWSTLENVLAETTQGIEEKWKYFELALIIINCIILLGIIISIKGDINSNRKQYAILRCMKINQKDLEKMILTQTIIFVLIGQVLGLIMGTIGSIVVSLSDGGRAITIPNYTSLILICVVSIILILLCVLPDTHMIKNQKIVNELVREEL